VPRESVLHVDVSLDIGVEPMTGSICVEHGDEVPFVGMLELLSLLDQAHRADEQGPPGRD
jgi:hypothetical protein